MYEIGSIGFGEAAVAFAAGWREAGLGNALAAYDVLFEDVDARAVNLRNALSPA